MNFTKATYSDLEQLVDLRIEVLRAANKLDESVEMDHIRETARHYYAESFQNDSHVAYLVSENGTIIGCGGISFYGVLPTFSNPSGKKAYIMNMFVRPEFRRRGIAKQLLDLLISEAKVRGISAILLESTDMGRPLYESYGFAAMNDEMELQLLHEATVVD